MCTTLLPAGRSPAGTFSKGPVRRHATSEAGLPRVLMGDLNNWSRDRGAMRGLGDGWTVLAPGRSFPSRSPVAMLDRIIHSADLHCEEAGVHHSALAAKASDHLPVWAVLGG